MPRFFFHIRDIDSLEIDPEGVEFDSVEAAVVDARAAAREMIAEMIRAGERLDGQQFEIADEHGRVVEVFPFRSVLNIQ
jgi:hypothetical protein